MTNKGRCAGVQGVEVWVQNFKDIFKNSWTIHEGNTKEILKLFMSVFKSDKIMTETGFYFFKENLPEYQDNSRIG